MAELDLTHDERQADGSFLWRWRSIARGAPRNDIGNIGAAPVEPDRRHHAIKQLPRAAHERKPLKILLTSGRLTDEHHPRLRVAVSESQFLGRLLEHASLETLENAAKFSEVCGILGRLPSRHHGRIRSHGRGRSGRWGRAG